MAKVDCIVDVEVLLRLVRRLAESFGEDESGPLSDVDYVSFIDDLAELTTAYLGGYVAHVTLHRKKLGKLAVKVTLDDRAPYFGVWLEHMQEH